MEKTNKSCHVFRKAREKVWRIMRLSCVFMLFFVLAVSARGIGQEQTVTLRLKQVNLYELFDAIRQQTGLQFLCNAEQVKALPAVDVDVKDKAVKDLLTEVLAGTSLTFSFDRNVVTVTEQKRDDDVRRNAISIKGFVCDERKQPMPGVTVAIKGLNLGTTTDAHGKYEITLPRLDSLTLIFSFVGYETQEIRYTGQDSINVILKEAMNEVEEVVVTGYQVIDRRKNTSAIQTLDMEDIKVGGVTTIDKLLEGRVPGMIFMQNSGQVGAAPKIRVRGTSTVLGNQEPVWVLDGIILRDPVNVDPQLANNLDFVNLVGNAISGINPDDIERIDILKDASATALYGASAANGVIVITTKKGRVGPPTITYSMSGTFTARPRYGDRAVYVMNSKERIDYSREIIEKKLSYPNIPNWLGYEGALHKYYNGEYTFAQFQQEVSRMEEMNTDWFDIITENTFSHNHTLSLSGGSSNIRYYASLGLSKENGVIKREKNDRYTAMLKVNGNFDKYAFNFMLQANRGERSYTDESVNILDYAYHTSRAVPAYNEDGSLFFYSKKGGRSSGEDLAFNALNEMKYARDENHNNAFILTADLVYKFTEHFKAQGVFSYGFTNTFEETFLDEKSWYAADLRLTNYGEPMDDATKTSSLLPMGGEYRENTIRQENYTARLQLDYNRFIGKGQKHLINASLGFELSSVEYNGKQKTTRGYMPERGKIFNSFDPEVYKEFAKWQMSNSEEARGILTDDIQHGVSGYATLTYTLNNAYSFNVNARIDASNKFGDSSNDKLLPVWSVSGSWDMKESILQNTSWVDLLTLRTSFGYQGNVLSTQSPELIIKKGEYNDFMDKYESSINQYPNPNLKWEKTASYNVSADFAFLNNRIRGTISYFYKKTKDAYLDKTVSDINGVESYVINSGTLENQGIELGFNFTPIKAGAEIGGFRWDFDPQIGQVVNKLLTDAINGEDYDETIQDEVFYDDYLNGNVQIKGEPLNTFFSYKFAGLSPEDGRPMFYDVEEELKDKYMKMEREEVFREVMEISGCRVPDIQGGFTNTFSYRHLSLSMNFAYSLGSKIRLLKLYETNRNGNTIAPLPERNVRREFVYRWRQPGDERKTNIPGLLANDEYSNTLRPWWYYSDANSIRFAQDIWQMYDNSNIRVVSGNYLKLQSLSFRYTLPDRLCEKLYLKSAYIGLSGTNLLTIASRELEGQDPAQSGTSDQLNLSIRPTYSINFSVTF